jgi:hypothetical protein
MEGALSRILLALMVALGLSIARPATASTPTTESLVGMWSRAVGQGHVREVVEFRADGTYASGLCNVISMGWCAERKATASRQGTFAVQGDVLMVDRGLVNMERGSTAVEAREAYRWRMEWEPPDAPPRPTSRPPLRRLSLTATTGEEIMLNEMPSAYRPRWVKRADQ